jgi:hypothetical protein
LRIYLSGGIRKSQDDHKKCWDEKEEEIVRDLINDAYEVVFFNPARMRLKRKKPLINFGLEIDLIKNRIS